MVELVVVIAIISALASMSYAYLFYLRHQSRMASTQAVIDAVATTISNHQAKFWTLADGTVRPIWDVNGDGLLDGSPTAVNAVTDPDAFVSAVVDSGYLGFVDGARPTLPKRNVDDLRRVVDAWRRPLRIAFALQVYGASGFGVWSAGPDGHDAPFAEIGDDLRSWEFYRE